MLQTLPPAGRYGNGGPNGLPSQPPAILLPPNLAYDTAYQTGNFGGLARYTYGSHLSAYARAVLNTPGLAHWWRFQQFDAGYGASGSWLNSTSMLSLSPISTYSIQPGLIPADASAKSIKLTNTTLRSADYFVNIYPGGHSGGWAAEWWMQLDALVNDSAYIGCWRATSGGQGWMVYANSGADLALYYGATSSTPAGTTGIISTGKLYHIVCNFLDFADYPSTIYVNGVLKGTVAKNVLTSTALNTTNQFEIGSYNNSAGGKMNGRIGEVAIYARALQPVEITQHYNAAFTRA